VFLVGSPLQGAVGGIGVSLWLPILDAMCNDHGTAFAQGDALPTSFGIFFWGNGFNPTSATRATRRQLARSRRTFRLSPS
jgi:hypothetical protein